jgi:hypothetical protein
MTALFNGCSVCMGALADGSRFYAAQGIVVLTLLATSFGLFEGVRTPIESGD